MVESKEYTVYRTRVVQESTTIVATSESEAIDMASEEDMFTEYKSSTQDVFC